MNGGRGGRVSPPRTRLPRRAAARSSCPAGRGRRGAGTRVAREVGRGGAGPPAAMWGPTQKWVTGVVGEGGGDREGGRGEAEEREREKRESEIEVLDPWKVPGLVRRLAGQGRCVGGRLG